MGKIVKCKYVNCIHGEDKDIPIEEAVAIGKSYYHKDCAQIKQDIAEIIDIFVKEFNPNVVFSQLQKAINDILFNRCVDSGMLLFGVKYYVKNKYKLNYPGGLYYVVQNKDVVREWNKMRCKQALDSLTEPIETVSEAVFDYRINKPKSITDLFGGE